jgi:hypothetical protein
MQVTRWLVMLMLALVAACGGGGGGSPPAAAPPPVLAGDSAAPALPALAQVVPVAAAPEDIAAGGVLLTRLSVTLQADATIGQVNAAAQLVGATSITFSQTGSTTLTFAVPRQADADALEALALRIEGQPGILFASGGRQPMPLDLPATGTTVANSGDFEHLLATRFPAAWNVRRVAENGCSGRKVTVIVPDLYFGTPPAFAAQLEASFSFDRTLTEPTATQSAERHGFQVVGALAAKFDALTSTGANPLPACLQLRLVNVHGMTHWEIVERTIAAVLRDTGPVIISSSTGYNLPLCGGNPCGAADVDGVRDFLRRELRNHFDQGISWGAFARQPDIAARLLVVQAAGNSANKLLGRIYPGLRSAQLGSPFAIATTLDRLEATATDPALWTPVALAGTPVNPAAQSIALDGSTINALKERRDRLLAHPVSNANLLLVGAASNVPRLADLRPAPFSNEGASVFVVGQDVTTIDVTPVDGTSIAAPQVAGLAAYLWLLEPALPQQPAATTAALLRSSAQNNLFLSRAIDAWGAVLALDAGSAPTPATARMRLAALDVDADGSFNFADLQAFRNAYLDSTGAPREPATPDHGRFDLNGDGFTGGVRTTPMDVDPSGSTRFGAPSLTTLQLAVGSSTLTIDETAVTDAQALCFYAKSGLYSGTDLAARDALLSDVCVNPSTSDCGLGPGSYALAGSLTRNETMPASSSQLAAQVTLCFGPTGRNVKVSAMSGTRSASINFVGFSPPLSASCTASIGLEFTLPPRPTQEARYSSLALPASGPGTSGNLFFAMLQTCNFSDGSSDTSADVGPVGAGTHRIAGGRIVEIDFTFANAEVSVQGRLLPVP